MNNHPRILSIMIVVVLIVWNGYLVTEVCWHPYDLRDQHSIESIIITIIGIRIVIDRGEIYMLEPDSL